MAIMVALLVKLGVVNVTPVPPVIAAVLVIEPLVPEVKLAVVFAAMMPELATVPFVPEAVRLTLEALDVRAKALVTLVAPSSVIDPVAFKGAQVAVAPRVLLARILPELLKLPTCRVLAAEPTVIDTDDGPVAAAL